MIGGRSENNIKCVMHDDLGRKNRTTRYNCRFSAASLALRVIFSVSQLWNIFGSFTEPFNNVLSRAEKSILQTIIYKCAALITSKVKTVF